jgi:hypothetical protein
VSPGDQHYMRSKSLKPEKKLRNSEDASVSCSSDEEMEIIANFIESVDVTEDSDQESSDEHSVSEALTSPQLRSTTSGSKSSSQHRKPAGGTSCDKSSVVLSEADAASPLPNIVEKKADFHARLRQSRETGEHQSSRKSKRSKSIIQDMIDMSLGKKKVQSSEKMLRTAFVEFYRGLGLLKSYWYLILLSFTAQTVRIPAFNSVVRFRPEYLHLMCSDVVTKAVLC